MTSTQQRAALQRQIWQSANDVRGAVDGWGFKQYVLGALFYRFISENFAIYIEGGNESIHYAELGDEVITPEIKDDAIKTKVYKSLPFNPVLKDKVKALCKAGILHEALLWLELKGKKLNGLDFDRQKIVGNYIVDFYCAEKAVVIEVDGGSHDSKQAEDIQRDEYLRVLGLIVIRLLAKDVLQNIKWGYCFIEEPPRPNWHPSRGGES